MSNYPDRLWGIQGPPESGKSTFLGANVERPTYVIDPDNRFAFVSGLGEGEIVRPATRAGNIKPLDIQEQAEIAVLVQMTAESIVVDTVSRIYSLYSRIASIKGNMSEDERKRRGLSKNKASDQVDKSNAMTILQNLAGFGVPVYYVWLTRHNKRDHQGNEETRTVISKMELDGLRSSLAAIIDFHRDVTLGYGATVIAARDFNGRPSNVDFTIYDKPNNYWRGGAERLERLMYTVFANEQEAVSWGMAQLKNDDYGEIQDLFAHNSSGDTWAQKSVSWIELVDNLVATRAESDDVRERALEWAVSQETGKSEEELGALYDKLFTADPKKIRTNFKKEVDALLTAVPDDPGGSNAA